MAYRTPKPPGYTAAHGYGARHKQERKRWQPLIDAGNGYCQQGLNGSSGTCLYPTRWIPPGTAWDLGHTDDRTAWIGPTHPRCNRKDGARKGGQVTTARRQTITNRRTRSW